MTFFNYMLNITSSTCVSLKQSPIMLKININLMSYFSGGIYMSNNKQPEVIDPEDKRYKDDDYFKQTKEHSQKNPYQSFNYNKHIGCHLGPFGCLGGCLSIILLLSFISYLVSFLF